MQVPSDSEFRKRAFEMPSTWRKALISGGDDARARPEKPHQNPSFSKLVRYDAFAGPCSFAADGKQRKEDIFLRHHATTTTTQTPPPLLPPAFLLIPSSSRSLLLFPPHLRRPSSMAANPDVRSVFEFLRRNGFVEAESALRDDVVHGGGIGGSSFASSSSSDRLSEFPRLPTPPPPVRVVVGRGRQWRHGASEDDGDECSSTSDSSAFVSMVSSPSDLVNPFGRWSATHQNGSEDDSSDSLSQFGTAREYNDAEMLNDSLWANDRRGVQLRQPCFEAADDSGCLSEDKYVMTVDAEEKYMRDMTGLDLVSGGFNSATSINCLDDVGCPLSSIDTARDTGKDPPHSRVLDTITTPICSCCSKVKESYRLESEEGYYSWCGEEIKEPHIPLYRSCYELMADEPNSLQSTQLDKFQSKLEDKCPSVSLEQNVKFCSEHDVNSSRHSSRNKEDLVRSSPEKELQMLDSMVAARSASTNGGSPSNYKSNRRRSKIQKDEVKDSMQDSSMQFHNAEKACMPDGNWEYERGGDREMIGGNGTNRDTEENGIDSDVHMLENQEEEYEIFDLRIIHRKNRTGFEENKDFPIVLNTIIAGRYYVSEYLGSAAFSKVIQAHDLQTGMDVCLKIIKNDKDFFDQSLDEIKLLKFVNKYDPADERHILRLFDYFYHQEHLFIVCELLRANLYEFQKFNDDSGGDVYFTLPRLQSITRQCLEALEYLHYLGIIHCDLKPENILIKSYSRCLIKVIDLGSSCFQTDNLCSYVQSRSYRAPEVILGLPYDQKIDIWSLGCILAELFSGDVLFPNDSLAMLLARMAGMIGPIDMEMLERGQETHKYFTSDYDLYYRNEETNHVEYIIPEKTSLEERLDGCDFEFIEFVRELLQINPDKRPTATEALEHPWLSHPY
ncbi:hypothetical protein ACLOJK_025654 [Asimina triloba]